MFGQTCSIIKQSIHFCNIIQGNSSTFNI